MEIWKDIPGYEGLYRISNRGNVKSLKDNHGNYREKILKSAKDRYNYLYVLLFRDGKRKHYKVHRLVAFAFIPKVEGKEFVDHIDGNRSNNVYTNLRYCTHKENHNFELCRKHHSEANSKQVLCIELNEIFESVTEAERETGINKSSISQCCNGKQKSGGGYTWKYIELLPCYN